MVLLFIEVFSKINNTYAIHFCMRLIQSKKLWKWQVNLLNSQHQQLIWQWVTSQSCTLYNPSVKVQNDLSSRFLFLIFPKTFSSSNWSVIIRFFQKKNGYLFQRGSGSCFGFGPSLGPKRSTAVYFRAHTHRSKTRQLSRSYVFINPRCFFDSHSHFQKINLHHARTVVFSLDALV